MDKKQVITALPALSLLAAGCGHSDGNVDVPHDARPNVIFLFADDLGYGDISCYGATRVATPNIDRLAAEGQRFTNAHATSATSTPSRFGLLTGMYPWRLPNTQIAPGNAELLIDTACYTLASAMHDCGYTTGAVGKWHLGLGPVGGTDFNTEIHPGPRDIGFDYEYLIPATVDRVPCVFIENGRVVNLDPADPITVDYNHKVGDWPTGAENPELLKLCPTHGHDNTIVNGISRIGWMTGGRSALWIDEGIADTIALKATRFIERHKDHPFFLYLGTNDVHVPRVPHPRFAGKSGMGPRGDVILQLDWTVGEVMRTLDSLGIADNTLFIFTSDNGPTLDDGYQDEAVMRLGGHKPSGIYRGGKYSLYEGGTRVPMIVRWPAVVRPGVQRALYSQIDVYRSLASLVGAQLPDGAAPDSEDRLAELLGMAHTDRRFVVEQNRQNTLALIHGDWKYLDPSDKQTYEYRKSVELGNSPAPQLFRIVRDEREQHDVAAEHPEIVGRMAAELDSIKQLKPKMMTR